MRNWKCLLTVILILGISLSLKADLTYHWRLDETSLTWDGSTWTGVQESVSGTPGRLWGFEENDDLSQSGLGVLGNTGPAGGGDLAYDFEPDTGIGGVATDISGVIPATGDFTVLAWIKTANAHETQGHVFSNNNGQPGRAALTINSQKVAFWSQGFSGQLLSTTNVNDDVWHEIGVSRRNGTFYILVDGVVENSAHYPAVSIDQGTFWMIGRARRFQFGFEGLVSDVKVYDVDYTQVATRAWGPMPASGQTNVGTADGANVNVDLGWMTARDADNPGAVNPDVTAHYLYMSVDQNVSDDPNLYYTATIPVSGDETTEQTYSVDLNYDGSYIWRVDEGLDDGMGGTYPPGDPNNITGFVWSFETLASIPLLTDPAVQFVDPGQTAEFTVSISSISTVTNWTWYKAGEPDTLVDDADPDITITNTQTSSTLEIANTAAADEGMYYFIAANSGGVSEPTAATELRIKRLLGHWKLDGNADDASGNGNHGTVLNANPVSKPDYVASADFSSEGGENLGQAFQAQGGNYIEIPNESFFDVYDNLTISVWVKGAGMNDNCPWVAKHEFIVGWNLGKTGAADTARFIARNAADYLRYGPWPIGTTNIQDGSWHQVVGVLDGNNGLFHVYVDGLLENTQAFDPAQMGENDAPILIGATQFNDVLNQLAENVMIDDVRIYNHALDSMRIAQDYTAVTGGSVCYDRPALDLDGSCIVDVNDLAEFSSKWLDCALVPDCLP